MNEGKQDCWAGCMQTMGKERGAMAGCCEQDMFSTRHSEQDVLSRMLFFVARKALSGTVASYCSFRGAII